MSTKALSDFHPSEIYERLEYLRNLRNTLPEYKKNAISYEIRFQEKTQFYCKESEHSTADFENSPTK